MDCKEKQPGDRSLGSTHRWEQRMRCQQKRQRGMEGHCEVKSRGARSQEAELSGGGAHRPAIVSNTGGEILQGSTGCDHPQVFGDLGEDRFSRI